MNSPRAVHDECASGLMPRCRAKNAAGISRGICKSVVPSRLRARTIQPRPLFRHFSFLTLRPHTHALPVPAPPPLPRTSTHLSPPSSFTPVRFSSLRFVPRSFSSRPCTGKKYNGATMRRVSPRCRQTVLRIFTSRLAISHPVLGAIS